MADVISKTPPRTLTTTINDVYDGTYVGIVFKFTDMGDGRVQLDVSENGDGKTDLGAIFLDFAESREGILKGLAITDLTKGEVTATAIGNDSISSVGSNSNNVNGTVLAADTGGTKGDGGFDAAVALGHQGATTFNTTASLMLTSTSGILNLDSFVGAFLAARGTTSTSATGAGGSTKVGEQLGSGAFYDANDDKASLSEGAVTSLNVTKNDLGINSTTTIRWFLNGVELKDGIYKDASGVVIKFDAAGGVTIDSTAAVAMTAKDSIDLNLSYIGTTADANDKTTTVSDGATLAIHVQGVDNVVKSDVYARPVTLTVFEDDTAKIDMFAEARKIAPDNTFSLTRVFDSSGKEVAFDTWNKDIWGVTYMISRNGIVTLNAIDADALKLGQTDSLNFRYDAMATNTFDKSTSSGSSSLILNALGLDNDNAAPILTNVSASGTEGKAFAVNLNDFAKDPDAGDSLTFGLGDVVFTLYDAKGNQLPNYVNTANLLILDPATGLVTIDAANPDVAKLWEGWRLNATGTYTATDKSGAQSTASYNFDINGASSLAVREITVNTTEDAPNINLRLSNPLDPNQSKYAVTDADVNSGENMTLKDVTFQYVDETGHLWEKVPFDTSGIRITINGTFLRVIGMGGYSGYTIPKDAHLIATVNYDATTFNNVGAANITLPSVLHVDIRGLETGSGFDGGAVSAHEGGTAQETLQFYDPDFGEAAKAFISDIAIDAALLGGTAGEIVHFAAGDLITFANRATFTISAHGNAVLDASAVTLLAQGEEAQENMWVTWTGAQGEMRSANVVADIIGENNAPTAAIVNDTANEGTAIGNISTWTDQSFDPDNNHVLTVVSIMGYDVDLSAIVDTTIESVVPPQLDVLGQYMTLVNNAFGILENNEGVFDEATLVAIRADHAYFTDRIGIYMQALEPAIAKLSGQEQLDLIGPNLQREISLFLPRTINSYAADTILAGLEQKTFGSFSLDMGSTSTETITGSLTIPIDGGSMQLFADGSYILTMVPDASGHIPDHAALSYTISDEFGLTDDGAVNWMNISVPNNAPVVANTTVNVDENASVTGWISITDEDANDHPMVVGIQMTAFPAAILIDGQGWLVSQYLDLVHSIVALMGTSKAPAAAGLADLLNYIEATLLKTGVYDAAAGASIGPLVSQLLATDGPAFSSLISLVTTAPHTPPTAADLMPAYDPAAPYIEVGKPFAVDAPEGQIIVTINDNGSYTVSAATADYLPAGAVLHPRSLAITVDDGHGGMARSVFDVSARGFNDDPTSEDVSVSTSESHAAGGIIPTFDADKGDFVTIANVGSIQSDAALQKELATRGTYEAWSNKVFIANYYNLQNTTGGDPTGGLVPQTPPDPIIPDFFQRMGVGFFGGLQMRLGDYGEFSLDASGVNYLSQGEHYTNDLNVTYRDHSPYQAATTSVIHIDVVGTNQTPFAAGAYFMTDENSVVNGTLQPFTFDYDLHDTHTFAIRGATPTANGEAWALSSGALLTFDGATGAFTYNDNHAFDWLNLDETYIDKFSYMTTDNLGAASSWAEVGIVIHGTNVAPNTAPVTGVDYTYVITDASGATARWYDFATGSYSDNGTNPLINDFDPDGDKLTVSALGGDMFITLASGATVTFSNDAAGGHAVYNSFGLIANINNHFASMTDLAGKVASEGLDGVIGEAVRDLLRPGHDIADIWDAERNQIRDDLYTYQANDGRGGSTFGSVHTQVAISGSAMTMLEHTIQGLLDPTQGLGYGGLGYD